MWWNAPLFFPSVVSLPLPLFLPLLPGLFTSYASRPILTLVPGAGPRHRRPRSSSSAANHVRPSIPSILFPTSPNVLPIRDKHSLRYTTPPLRPQLTCLFFLPSFFCWVRPTDTGTRGALHPRPQCPSSVEWRTAQLRHRGIIARTKISNAQSGRPHPAAKELSACVHACACRWQLCLRLFPDAPAPTASRLMLGPRPAGPHGVCDWCSKRHSIVWRVRGCEDGMEGAGDDG